MTPRRDPAPNSPADLGWSKPSRPRLDPEPTPERGDAWEPPASTTSPLLEQLGRAAHEAHRRMRKAAPWDELTETQREVYRRMGEAGARLIAAPALEARRCQIRYFRDRRPEALSASKAAERRLDALLGELDASPAVQQWLRLGGG